MILRKILGFAKCELHKNSLEKKNNKVKSKYKNEDIYCVIRLFSSDGGLFCFYLKALEGLRYCMQNGYIPVIDMQTKENIFTTAEQRKNVNIWDMFWQQPINGITYEGIKNKPNKIILENPVGPVDFLNLRANNHQLEYWRRLSAKYIRYSEKMCQFIERNKPEKFDSEKTLGVLLRGTDYLNPLFGHCITITTQDMIDNVEVAMIDTGCTRIFLATEDNVILEAMKDHFGDKLSYIDQKRYSGKSAEILGHLDDYKKDAVEMNYAYLASMHYLSKCDHFWGVLTSGTRGIYIMNEDGYKSFELYKNPVDKSRFDLDKI